MDNDRKLEYQCLRSDIERIDNNTFGVIKFSIAACFVIVTFGITETNALAAYIRTFVEQDDSSAGYERRLFALRPRFRPHSQSPKIHGRTVFWMFALSGVLTIALVVLVFARERIVWLYSRVVLPVWITEFYFLGRWRRWAEAGGELNTALSAVRQIYQDEVHGKQCPNNDFDRER